MTRALALTIAVVIVSTLTPEAAQGLFLTGPAAKDFSRRAVKQHPKMGYENGFAKKVKCESRSRLRQRCRMRWEVGPAQVEGFSTINLRRNGDAAYKLDFKAHDYTCSCTYDYPNWRGTLRG